MTIRYQQEPSLSVDDFCVVLKSSGLAARRPIDDHERLEKMLDNADIILTARIEGKIIGISRAITDFSYCCYLSDLAVDATYQKQGIGKRLISETRKIAGDGANLVLLSAPDAFSYYEHIDMKRIDNGWIFLRGK